MFLIGILIVVFTFSVVKRTEHKFKKSFIYLFISGIFLIIHTILNILGKIDILKASLINYFTTILFMAFFLMGIINLEHIISELTGKSQVLYVIPRRKYLSELNKVVKSLKGKICCISLANSSVKLMNHFKKNNINRNITFLDVKSSDEEIKNRRDAHKIKRTLLKDLRSLIGVNLKENNFDYLVVDNINSIGTGDSRVFKTIRGIMLNSKKRNTQGIYFCIKEETKPALIRGLKRYVNKVIRK